MIVDWTKLHNRDDLDDHLAIMATVETIVARLPDVKPERNLSRLGITYLYRFGDVGELANLSIACVAPRLRFGILSQAFLAPCVRNVIMCPGLPNDGFNRAMIESQTSIHHEVAHLLLGHRFRFDLGNGYAKDRPTYFNHPAEREAYFHQALARAARQDVDGYGSDDSDTFAKAVVDAAYGPFLKALTPENGAAFHGRIQAFHAARLERMPGLPAMP